MVTQSSCWKGHSPYNLLMTCSLPINRCWSGIEWSKKVNLQVYLPVSLRDILTSLKVIFLTKYSPVLTIRPLRSMYSFLVTFPGLSTLLKRGFRLNRSVELEQRTDWGDKSLCFCIMHFNLEMTLWFRSYRSVELEQRILESVESEQRTDWGGRSEGEGATLSCVKCRTPVHFLFQVVVFLHSWDPY